VAVGAGVCGYFHSAFCLRHAVVGRPMARPPPSRSGRRIPQALPEGRPPSRAAAGSWWPKPSRATGRPAARVRGVGASPTARHSTKPLVTRGSGCRRGSWLQSASSLGDKHRRVPGAPPGRSPRRPSSDGQLACLPEFRRAARTRSIPPGPRRPRPATTEHPPQAGLGRTYIDTPCRHSRALLRSCATCRKTSLSSAVAAD
jgi:hypothetical protein